MRFLHRGKSKKDRVELRRPESWLMKLLSSKREGYRFALAVLFILAIGIILQHGHPFPYFYTFTGLFLFIGCVSLFAERWYCREIRDISTLLASQPCASQANYFLTMHGTSSPVFIIAPVVVVLTFGVGGCLMFRAIRLTPTLIWILFLFSVVVYISIVGYLQYVVLAIYIIKLSRGRGEYKRTPKAAVNYIPADIAWIQRLTKLTHIYRSVFFTLGCTYISAFAAFCYLPDMNAAIHSVWYFFLWGIIFAAIVVTFPIVSIFEYRWIKKIVLRLKESYVHDLEKEGSVLEKAGSGRLATLLVSMNARQILNSKDYPFRSALSAGYAAALALINLVTAATTILSDTVPLIDELRQSFL